MSRDTATTTDAIFEQYQFLCARKGGAALDAMLGQLLALALAELNFHFDDRPDQAFANFSARSQKIIRDAVHDGRLAGLDGTFDGGGCFRYQGGRLTVAIHTNPYNFEVVDALKNFLSEAFPICVFRNPYIWGINLYTAYSRERLFETRVFSQRSQILEQPEVDIFRRDEGIVFKLRFFLRDEPADLDSGLKHLEELAAEMLEAIERRNYEGLELLGQYCRDRAGFRRIEPRTKLGRVMKGALGG